MDTDANVIAALTAAAAAAQADGGEILGADTRALNQAFAVVVYRPDGRIESANFQFLRLLGCNLGEVIGQDAMRFLSKSCRRQRLNELWSRLAAGKRHQEVGLWIAAGGKEIWLESRYVPLISPEGRTEAVVQIAEDVTGRLAREVETPLWKSSHRRC